MYFESYITWVAVKYNLFAYTKENKLKIAQSSFIQLKESLSCYSHYCEKHKLNSSEKKTLQTAVTDRVELNYLRFQSTKKNCERSINITKQECSIHPE